MPVPLPEACRRPSRVWARQVVMLWAHADANDAAGLLAAARHDGARIPSYGGPRCVYLHALRACTQSLPLASSGCLVQLARCACTLGSNGSSIVWIGAWHCTQTDVCDPFGVGLHLATKRRPHRTSTCQGYHQRAFVAGQAMLSPGMPQQGYPPMGMPPGGYAQPHYMPAYPGGAYGAPVPRGPLMPQMARPAGPGAPEGLPGMPNGAGHGPNV